MLNELTTKDSLCLAGRKSGDQSMMLGEQPMHVPELETELGKAGMVF